MVVFIPETVSSHLKPLNSVYSSMPGLRAAATNPDQCKIRPDIWARTPPLYDRGQTFFFRTFTLHHPAWTFSLFPEGLVIKSFTISANSKLEKMRRNRLLYPGWLTKLQQFQGARPHHVRVESSKCCFSRELVSYVRPTELAGFDPRQVTRSPSIGKRIWVGRHKNFYSFNSPRDTTLKNCSKIRSALRLI